MILESSPEAAHALGLALGQRGRSAHDALAPGQRRAVVPGPRGGLFPPRRLSERRARRPRRARGAPCAGQSDRTRPRRRAPRAVSARAAASGEAGGAAWRSAVATGSPTFTRTDAERKVPGSWKTSPTGSRATPPGPLPPRSVSSRMRAAPVRSGRSMGCDWVRPSGKMRMAPPARRAPITAANIPAFFAGSSPASCRRCTGTAPMSQRKGPTSGWRNSGAFASTVMGRGRVAMMSMASATELW